MLVSWRVYIRQRAWEKWKEQTRTEDVRINMEDIFEAYNL